MLKKIKCFFHEQQLNFHPKYEWALGNRIKHPETTKRAESIYKSITKKNDLFDIVTPVRIPLKAIKETHGNQLLTLYNTAGNLEVDNTFYPSVFPQRRQTKPDPLNIYHAGYFCFDSGTPLNNQTWTAAGWSAACAYSAAESLVKQGSSISYALSRPPGHHASKDTYGGYCYFNNAAIAAKYLKKHGRVAIIDIDFHHGNGTQDIFYKDGEVLVISLHGDPREHFPYLFGFPGEMGVGDGEGLNVNIILPNECDSVEFLHTLEQKVQPLVNRFEADFLVISAGFDTYYLDPIGSFKLMTNDYFSIAQFFKKLNLPVVICQEGGYFAKDLGSNVTSFLAGFVSS